VGKPPPHLHTDCLGAALTPYAAVNIKARDEEKPNGVEPIHIVQLCFEKSVGFKK
jgi:hypothetical protein